MSEYNIAFGKKLAETARIVLDNDAESYEARQTAAYLSLLSSEISLKAMLEKAGVNTNVVRKRSHHLNDLLNDICGCEIEVQVAPGLQKFVSAARLCSMQIQYQNGKTTVGRVLRGEQEGASVYPNEVRYGDNLKHFPPEVLVEMADAVATFAAEHWDSIRIKK